MDKLIYTAMTGARMLAQRQESIAHNLANANTNGYRAQTTAFRATPVNGPGVASRVAAVETSTGSDFRPGPLLQTGNPFDVAISGSGFFAVQAPDGSEAYTRDGQMELSPEGNLVSKKGHPLIGEGGPLTIPANHEVMIGRDGTISAVPAGAGKQNSVTVGRLKLVNPDEKSLVRGGDGLFRVPGGEADADPAVTVSSGSVEASNVNVVEALVDMISVARHFETQMKLMSSAEQNARAATQLLSISG
ncbi:MAG: flagellar basal-body rod protein FlgF [Burkholderiales bacterium]